MVDKPEVAADSATDLRNKLIKRLAVAGVLVAVLLGVLAFFDYLASPPEEPDDQVFNKPVPVAPKKQLSQPVTPTTDLPEPPPTATVAAEAPPAPQVAAQPAPVAEEKTEGKPTVHAENRATAPAGASKTPAAATPAVAGKAPAAPAPSATPALKLVRPVPESTAAPTVATSAESFAQPASRPSARVIDTRPAPVVVPSGMSRLFAGFLLQAGVFTSPQRAEELHAKLTLSGVPSTLETRVQVGPFTTRQEAEAAQVKLRELGIETVLVPPKSVRH
jgi:DedD protein